MPTKGLRSTAAGRTDDTWSSILNSVFKICLSVAAVRSRNSLVGSAFIKFNSLLAPIHHKLFCQGINERCPNL